MLSDVEAGRERVHLIRDLGESLGKGSRGCKVIGGYFILFYYCVLVDLEVVS